MPMTKKNYVKAAKLIQATEPKVVANQLEEAFVEFFQDDNPRFDEERFRFACNREVK